MFDFVADRDDRAGTVGAEDRSGRDLTPLAGTLLCVPDPDARKIECDDRVVPLQRRYGDVGDTKGARRTGGVEDRRFHGFRKRYGSRLAAGCVFGAKHRPYHRTAGEPQEGTREF